jgi:hypothetical protein
MTLERASIRPFLSFVYSCALDVLSLADNEKKATRTLGHEAEQICQRPSATQVTRIGFSELGKDLG